MPLQPKPASCTGCPAQHTGQGFTRPVGKPTAQFLVIGPGPDEDSVHQNEPYTTVSTTGEAVTRRLYHAGLTRGQVILTDLVWCWMPDPTRSGRRGNRLPTRAETRHCWREHLGPYLAGLPELPSGPRQLVTLGLPPLRWFKGLTDKQPAEIHLGTTELHTMPPVVAKEEDCALD